MKPFHPHDPAEARTPPAPGAAPTRRRWLYGAVACAAALGGAGVAWRRLQLQPVQTEAEAHLWSLQWETPQGEPLLLADFRGKRLLLNFWATWCPPCVDELPLLNAFQREHGPHGWQVLGLAIDQPSAVRRFLQRLPLDFPVGMAGLGGTDLARSLGNLTGALPFTVVLAADGRVLHRKMGKVSSQDLIQWARLVG